MKGDQVEDCLSLYGFGGKKLFILSLKIYNHKSPMKMGIMFEFILPYDPKSPK